MLEMPAQASPQRRLQGSALLQLPGKLMLDVTGHVAMTLGEIEGIQNQESVESKSVPRRVNFRLYDVIIDTVEKFADTRKQIFLITDIDQHLDARSRGGETRPDYGRGRLDVLPQMPGMPRNFFRLMEKDIRRIKRRPQPLMHIT